MLVDELLPVYDVSDGVAVDYEHTDWPAVEAFARKLAELFRG